jgi:hypothetical protein
LVSWIFFSFFSPLFCKKYMVFFFLQNYTSSAVGDGGRGACGTVMPAIAVGHISRGLVCFQNFLIFCLNSNGGKLYMKIVAFDEIYNFVVQSFSIWSHLHSQIIDKLSRSQLAVFRSE